MAKQYETVIGLEVHVELRQRQRFFADAAPHLVALRIHIPARCAPVCRGSLPVLNKKVVEYAMAVGLATNCDDHPVLQI